MPENSPPLSCDAASAQQDLALLTEAARASGQIATGFFGAAPDAWDKPNDAGPVTEADLAVNDMLHDRLRAARPDYGWLSEETEDDATRCAQDRVFIVDPIDGTRAFIEGSKDWSHALAVAERGVVTAAAVYLPLRDLMFTAVRGRGAAVNGRTLHAATRSDLEGAQVLATRSTLRSDAWQPALPPVKQVYRSSLAYRLCLVAEGRFDAMITLRPAWEWDIAAGALIAQEAGARVCDIAGQGLRFNTPGAKTNGVLAGPPDLVATLCAALPGKA